jgi:hypothetical protein
MSENYSRHWTSTQAFFITNILYKTKKVMRIKGLIFIFTSLMCIQYVFAGDLLCNDWLLSLGGKKSHLNHPGTDASDGDDSDKTYTLSDKLGVKGACRDKFPTWGEREMFYRTSSDPFTVKFVVKRQYCWARYVISPPPTNCGGPKWDCCIGFFIPYLTWDHGAAYTSWGDTKSVTFDYNETGKNNYKTIFWGSNYAYVDYKDMKDENGKKKKDINGNVLKDPKVICAYYSPKFVADGFTEGDLIGCVSAPLMPAPPIYNKTLVPQNSAVIANNPPSNSTFSSPKINLTVIDSEGREIGPVIQLTYSFDIPDDQQNCTSLLEQIYCPMVTSAAPSKICAYFEGDKSNVLGCIDRPKPKDSGIKIEAIYDYYIDEDCNIGFDEPSVFKTLRIKLTQPNGDFRIYPSDNMHAKDGIREYYACNKEMETANKPIKIRTSGYDVSTILGVDFSAIIPKFNGNSHKFKKMYIRPPQILQNPQDSYKKSCKNCFVEIGNAQEGQEYIVPAGERNRNSCKKSYYCVDNSDQEVIQRPKEYCSFGYNDQYNDAEKSYCRGVYTKSESGSSTSQDKICIKLETDWPGILENEQFFGNEDKICADVPQTYLKLDKEDVSSITGYIDFSHDGYDPTKNYPPEQKFYGVCDASFGVERESCLSTDKTSCVEGIPHLTNADIENDNQELEFKSKFIILKSAVTAAYANMPALTKQIFSLLGVQVKDGIGIISKGAPYRTLDGNYPIGKIHNPCKFQSGANGCTKNTYTNNALGNAYYTHNTNLGLGSFFELSSNSSTDSSTGMSVTDFPIGGKCKPGFSSLAIPQRICKVITNKDNKIISKSWSNFSPINPCSKNMQQNR